LGIFDAADAVLALDEFSSLIVQTNNIIVNENENENENYDLFVHENEN